MGVQGYITALCFLNATAERDFLDRRDGRNILLPRYFTSLICFVIVSLRVCFLGQIVIFAILLSSFILSTLLASPYMQSNIILLTFSWITISLAAIDKTEITKVFSSSLQIAG